MYRNIDRNEFFRKIGAGAAAAALITSCGGSGGGDSKVSSLSAGRRNRPRAQLTGARLAVIHGSDPATITRAAVDKLGGMGKFVSSGAKVLLKPNIGWDRVPEQAATTNPEVVRAVAQMCLEAGAKEVSILDNSINDARRCYQRSKMIEVAGSLQGVEAPFVESFRFKEIAVGGKLIQTWPIYSPAIEADVLINLPVAKHHSLSKLSIGMKNLYGLVGGRRNQLHQDVNLSIAELTDFFRPDLTIVDAVRILVSNGPSGGSLSDVRQTDTVIASADPIAADARAAALFDVSPTDLSYLSIGAEMGLGTLDLQSLSPVEVTV